MKSRVPKCSAKVGKHIEHYKMFLEAKDDVAQQVIAAVLYAYHLQGFRRKRINDMYETILSVIHMPPIAGKHIEGIALMDFLTKEYGIDFDRITLMTETGTEHVKRMMK